MAERDSVCVGSDSFRELFCDLCSVDGKLIKAEGFCTSCVDYLCMECVTAHKKHSRTHAILEKDMPQRKPKLLSSFAVEDDSCVEKCDRHQNEFIKYYCRTHTSLGCNVCITIDHRLCEGIEHIPDVAEDILGGKEQQELLTQLDNLKSKSQNVLKLSESNKTDAEKASNATINSTQHICLEIRDVVKTFEESTKREAKTLKTTNLNRLKDVEDKCNHVLSEIEKSASNLQSLQSNKQYTQLFIMVKKLSGRIQTWDRNLDEASSGNTVSACHAKSKSLVQQIVDRLEKVTAGKGKYNKIYDCVPNETCSCCLPTRPGPPAINWATKPKLYKETNPLRGHQPAYVLEAKNTECQDNQAKNTECQDKADGVRTEMEGGQELIAEHLHDITVKSKGDSSELGCHITSLAIVSDDKVVVADRRHNKLKLINLDSKTVVSDLSLPSGPWSVASIIAQKIGVTLPDDRKIAIVRVTKTNTIVLDKKISVGGCCRNIVLYEEKLIVLFSDKPARLEILSLNGKCEKKLVKDDLGKELFVNPQSLALGPDGTVFVLDDGDKCVKCVSLDGTVTEKYKNMVNTHAELLCLVVLDQHGRVAVCVWGSHYGAGYVFLLEEDGIKPLLGRLSSPESLMYCKRTGRLYIGFHNVNSISVYQLFHASPEARHLTLPK